jgi:hypothetical protein
VGSVVSTPEVPGSRDAVGVSRTSATGEDEVAASVAVTSDPVPEAPGNDTPEVEGAGSKVAGI